MLFLSVGRAVSEETPPMKFVENGPDVPPALLLAHQDGKVVFFLNDPIDSIPSE